MIQCPNYSCQALNAEAHSFCHQCQAPLPRRFLWAVGHRASDFSAGTLVSDRYLCKAPQIFLDTKPGIPPGTLSDIPAPVLPYLQLTHHRLHLPEVYGWADGTLESGDVVRLMFLENPAIQVPSRSEADHPPIPRAVPQLLPTLHTAWSSASAFQQLQWLWQIAQLWKPLSNEHIAATLLSDHLIRVEASLVRILQLQTPIIGSTQPRPTLNQLGKQWESLVSTAHPDLQVFLKQLCHKLSEGQIPDSLDLVQILDIGIQSIGRSHALHIGIAAQTDKGPSRANNQDACFPTSGQLLHHSSTGQPPAESVSSQIATQPESYIPTQLIVVCDGIGGHQGGEVASAIAIEQLTQNLDISTLEESARNLASWTVHAQIDQAIATANDAINQQNDAEQRRDRERMGTTVVLGVIHDHSCYLAHVGDSRVYWITQAGCHQITLDDDVASRDARLGYGTYRSVLYHPNAGALVQALGMGPSEKLYPSSQRLILGGEGILLFCSDGLSDQDLIETSWQSIFLPLLNPGEDDKTYLDLDSVAQSLIDLANTRNGHDNVTVGLVQWQSHPIHPIQLPDIETLVTQAAQAAADSVYSNDTPQSATRSFPSLAALLDPSNGNANDPTGPPNTDPGHPSAQGQRTAFPASIFDDASSDIPSAPSSDTHSSESPFVSTTDSEKTDAEDSTIWLSPNDQAERKSPLLAFITTLFSVGGILILAGALIYIWVPGVSDRINTALGIKNTDAPTPIDPQPNNDSSGPEDSADNPVAPFNNPIQDTDGENLVIGNILNVRTSAPRILPNPSQTPQSDPPSQGIQLNPSESLELKLFQTPPVSSSESETEESLTMIGIVPWGSVLKVQSTLQLSDSFTEATDNDTASGDTVNDDRRNPDIEGGDRDFSPEASERVSALAAEPPQPTAPDPLSLPDSASVITAPERWVQVQLCSSPEDIGQPDGLRVGSIGWTSERHLKELSYLDKSQASPPGEPCSSLP